MLVHPNPMVKQKTDHWEDTHLKVVQIRPILLNFGLHRKRWGVYYFKGRFKIPMVTSRHITEEQAVVSAQTLANRLYRLKNSKAKRSRRLSLVTELTISDDRQTNLIAALQTALDQVQKGNIAQARHRADLLIQSIQQSFKLK